jgi:hypothetical protein
MANPSLQQVLDYFMRSSGAVSIALLARELDLSPGLVESMVDFWVRKGRIQRLDPGGRECGGCSRKGSCPLIAELPVCYRVVQRKGSA